MKKSLSSITKATVSIFAILLLARCAVPALSNEPMMFRKETAKNGLIIGSITFPKEKAKFNGYFIRITGTDADSKKARKNSTEIQISPEQVFRMRHAGQLDGGLTYLFAIERPEGPYEIPSIRLFSNSGIAVLQKTGYCGGFSIPFDVKTGEITYVGNLFFNEYAGENDTLVKYRNRYDRDIAAIKKLQPRVNWDKAVNDSGRKVEYSNKPIKP